MEDDADVDPDVMVFRPTEEEFACFPRYIQEIERRGAHKIGLAKVIPPKSWRARQKPYNEIEFKIPTPINQEVHGKSGIYTQYNITRRAIHLKEFRSNAYKSTHSPPVYKDYGELEKAYWRSVTAGGHPLYGADIPGSFFDDDVKSWNLSSLGTILDMVMNDCKIKIDGVTTPYLYFGMWRTTFAWHTEDMDLYSINYLHDGAVKFWYTIPPDHGAEFERVAESFFQDTVKTCPAFLRHKMTVISPKVLAKYGIPVHKMVQRHGEFMITFPYAYHSGFNAGFNIAEATNFATQRWIDYGKRSHLCYCNGDTVRINMDLFVKRFQPDEYDDWLKGKTTAAGVAAGAGDAKALAVPAKRLKMDAAISSLDSEMNSTKSSTMGLLSPILASTPQGTPHHSSTDSSSLLSTTPSPETKKYAGMKSEDDLGPWAGHLFELWNWKRFDLRVERKFNQSRALREPHCSICQYFVPKSLSQTVAALPERSRRILRDIGALFASNHWSSAASLKLRGCDVSSSASVHAQDVLLQCSSCAVTVHAGCYNVGIVEVTYAQSYKQWLCKRCDSRDMFAECQLCCLRGGALVPVEDVSWVHPVCAILVPNAIQDRSTKNLIRLRFKKTKHPCFYCGNHMGGKVMCGQNGCDRRFHVTCGHETGCHFELRDWPVLISVICTNHNLPNGDQRESIIKGQQVWAPLPVPVSISSPDHQPQFEPAEVFKIELATFCVVDFEDGSFSNNMLPGDIEQCSCLATCNGAHVTGAKVKARWTDGEVYPGTFRRAYSTEAYHVKFGGEHDGKINVCTREDVLVLSDPNLPPGLKKKMRQARMRKNS